MTVDWTKMSNEYKGQWIALKEDQTTILSSGDSLKKVIADAKVKGFKDPIVTKIPKEIVPYIS